MLDERGQATVEAAFALPVMMLLILLLVQPAIVLYDKMIMQSAAAEGCRLLSTSAPGDENVCEDFVRRRLGAIPPHELFHIHSGGCTWNVGLEGNESSETVSVSISTEVRPLPLVGAGAAMLGMTNESGNFEVSVECSAKTQPDWVGGSEAGLDPAEWIGSWA